MKVSLFDYHLPEELIAQYPLPERDESRLMVLKRDTREIQHTTFTHLLDFLSPGDLLVLNNTKVIPARLIGKKERSKGKVEILLLTPKGEGIWEALVKRSSRISAGTRVVFGDGRLVAKILGKSESEGRLVQFEHNGDLRELLDEFGRMPLPPYIKRQAENSDKERYQTIYAKKDGAVAAPTAGLHFTKAFFSRLEAKNIGMAEVTLHVGLGTFQPVRTENVEEHDLHSEYFEITPETVRKINETRRSGGRIVAVGTTSVRTLESSVASKTSKTTKTSHDLDALDDLDDLVVPRSGFTDAFIYPGYEFRIVDALVTNFHLPRSTLLMLVSAFAGREFVMEAYREAVEKQYRFYSYGDAMLII